MIKNDSIIGCFGLITNDFISRQDLYPWLCALFVEEHERGKQLGARMLEFGLNEADKLGYSKVYLCTSHNNFYEKYGWTLFVYVKSDGEEKLSRMYMKKLPS